MSTKRKLALIIGCSYNFSNPPITPKLKGTCNDARHMVSFLKQHCGYKDENIVLMVDDTITAKNTDRYPTRNNIFNQMRAILNNAQSIDEVTIFYAGHGTQQVVSSSNTEESDRLNEVIVPVDYNIRTGANAITDDTVNSLLREFGKSQTQILLIFDCCHSGTMCDLNYTYYYDRKTNIYTKSLSPNPRFDPTMDHSFANKPILSSVVALSGCKDNEVSMETKMTFDGSGSNAEEGVLTSSFIYSIRTNPTSTKDIFGIVRDMDRYTQRYNQHPVISSNMDLTATDPKFKSIFDGAQYIINSRSDHVSDTNNQTEGNGTQMIKLPRPQNVYQNKINPMFGSNMSTMIPQKISQSLTQAQIQGLLAQNQAKNTNKFVYKSLNQVDLMKFMV